MNKYHTQWHLFLMEHKGQNKTIQELSTIYREKYKIHRKRKRPSSLSKCVKIEQNECIPPDCYWKEEIVSNLGRKVKAHCRSALYPFARSKYYEINLKNKRQTECKGKSKEECLDPCSWSNESIIKRGVNKGKNREGYCSKHGNSLINLPIYDVKAHLEDIKSKMNK